MSLSLTYQLLMNQSSEWLIHILNTTHCKFNPFFLHLNTSCTDPN